MKLKTKQQQNKTGKTKDNGQFPEPFFIQSDYSSGVPTISWEQQRAKDQTSR